MNKPASGRFALFNGVIDSRTLPIYAMFFLWSLGTGSLFLARPILASSFGASVFLITLIISSSAVGRIVASPITGLLADRWGRKPLVIIGNAIRGGTTFAIFFSDSYVELLVLEFIGNMGVTIWVTSSQVLVADVTDPSVRGKVVATRNIASRVGLLSGPVFAGVLAATIGVRYAFLFNGITKVMIFFLTLYLIKESKPETQPTQAGTKQAPRKSLRLSPFRNRTFAVLAFAAFSNAIMSHGVYQAILPVYAQETVGLTAAGIGGLMGIAGTISLVVSLPNGIIIDRYGRKKMMVPGVALVAVAAYLLGISTDYGGLLTMVLVYGMAEGMTMGTTQVFAMDLAPPERRGAFLGVWSLVASTGTLVGPLGIGFAVTRLGFGSAFLGLAVWIGIAALLVAVFATDTRGRADSTWPLVNTRAPRKQS